jgi:hypothetical protein
MENFHADQYHKWKTARMIVTEFSVPFAFWKPAGIFQTANAIDSDMPPQFYRIRLH